MVGVQQTMPGPRIWRRISHLSGGGGGRKTGTSLEDLALRKAALELLRWPQEDTRVVLTGKVTAARWGAKHGPGHALLASLGERRDAALVLLRDKGGRLVPIRDPPLALANCVVVATEMAEEDAVEVVDHPTRDALIFKGETREATQEWLNQLRLHTKNLGAWRKRRNALANIMINGVT